MNARTSISGLFIVVGVMLVGGLVFFDRLFSSPETQPQVQGVQDATGWMDADVIGVADDGGQRSVWALDLNAMTKTSFGEGRGLQQVMRAGKQRVYFVRRQSSLSELGVWDEAGEEVITVASELTIQDVDASGGVLVEEGTAGSGVLYWDDGSQPTIRVGNRGDHGELLKDGSGVLFWSSTAPTSSSTLSEIRQTHDGQLDTIVIGDFGRILMVQSMESGVWMIDQIKENGDFFNRLFHRQPAEQRFEKVGEWRDPFGTSTISQFLDRPELNAIEFIRQDASGYTERWRFQRSNRRLSRQQREGSSFLNRPERQALVYLQNDEGNATRPGRLMQFDEQTGTTSALPFAQTFTSLFP